MAKSTKNIFGKMTEGNLFRDFNGAIFPELDDIWKHAISPREPRIDKLKDGDPVTLLLFRRYEDAIWWELLAAFRIPIKGYRRLFKKQHGYSFDKPNYQPPDRIATTVNGETSLALTADNDTCREYQKRYLLNEYERSRGWCPFCRGLGYMMVLRADQKLTTAGIPTMPYKLKCVHAIAGKTKQPIVKRPSIVET